MTTSPRGSDGPHQPQRWRVLAVVTSLDSPMTVDEITDEVHERVPPEDPMADLESWDRTHQRLHDVELPALDVVGLIEFDQDRGVVTVPPAATEWSDESEDAASTDDTTDEDGRLRWRHAYLTAALASVAIVLVSTTTVVQQQQNLAVPVAAGAVVVLFATLAVTQTLDS